MVLVEATSGTMSMKDYGVSDELVDALIVVDEKRGLLKSHLEVSENQLRAAKQSPEFIAKIKLQPIPNDLLKKIDTFRKIENKAMDDLHKMNKKILIC